MANRILLGNVKGIAGATGSVGATGPAGANGLTPYIQNGTWWLGTQDTGVTASGNQWFTGNGAPTTQGINGDLYLDVDTGNVYKKAANVWNVVANIKGSKGDAGAKGDKGDTALTVRVGTVTTTEAGTEASVTNSGTNTDLVLNFEIPRGAKGEKGERGEAGQGTTDTQFDLLSENPIANNVVTQNIVIRKSGLELSQLVGQTSSIYADMYTPCICNESYDRFVEGHIYLIYNEAYGTDSVRYRVAVKEIGVTGKKTETTETFSNVVWTEDTAITPFGFRANVTLKQDLTENTEVSIGNPILEQSKFGLVVGEMSGQVVTLYALNEPNVDVVVKLEV